MKLAAAFLLFIVGSLVSFYAGFSLLGGPDGALLSKASFRFGLPSVAIAAILLLMAKKNSGAGVYVFLPLGASVIAFLFAVALNSSVGFNLWLYGVPLASLVALVIWFFSGSTDAQKMPNEQG